MANLTWDLTFDEAFISYDESWRGDCVCFEGVLRKDFVRSTDLTVVKFVSGGRRYKTYKLEREGTSFKGWIQFPPFVPLMATEDVKADKELVRKIRLVVDKGASVVDTARYFNVPYEIVVNIKRRQGAFKSV